MAENETSHFLDKYKAVPLDFTDGEVGRVARVGKHQTRRKDKRDENFGRCRNISPIASGSRAAPNKKTNVASQPALSPMSAKLQKWRAEKALKKKIEQTKKKPVFKVGIVHHRYYSPTANDKQNSKSVPCHTRGAFKVKRHPTPPKRITRATQKRLDEKKKAGIPITPGPSTSTNPWNTKTITKKSPPKKKPSTSFAPDNFSFKGPLNLAEIPAFGRYRDSEASTSVSDTLNDIKEIPWPSSTAAAAEIVPPQQMRNRLTRQLASDYSLDDDTENSPVKDDNRKSKENGCILTPLRASINSDEEQKSIENEPAVSRQHPTVEEDEEGESSENECAAITVPLNIVDEELEKKTETLPDAVTDCPAMFSPYVIISRGKDSARKERRSKLGLGRMSTDAIPTKETVMQNLNISLEDEERTAQYFKFLLQREIDRLTKLCSDWYVIQNDPDLTEDAALMINQAIGQTKLLIKKKFERFRSLVLDCETGKGEMLVQCQDLQGFWDLIYMEVKDCDARFSKLEVLKSKNWVEDETKVPRKKTANGKKRAKPKIAAKSSARSWIMARKKIMSQTSDSSGSVAILETDSDESKPSTSGSTEPLARRSSRKSIQPFSPRIGRRSTSKATPVKTPVSLLKKLCLSGSNKSVHSPLAIMKISKMCKTPEVRLDETISYVNSDQTPGKSILKKSKDSTNSDSSAIKSSRKVDFHDHIEKNEKPINEDLENSLDLGRALAEIDNYDSDASDNVFEEVPVLSSNITVRNIEKRRLDFEDETFNETENSDIAESATAVAAAPDTFDMPAIKITERTPAKRFGRILSPALSSQVTKRPNITHKSVDKSIDEVSPSPRILRNRKIDTQTPSQTSRRRSKSMAKANFDSNSSMKENYNPQKTETKIDEAETSKNVVTEGETDDHPKRRRSTRKSVRFNADDCFACTESMKTVHPMTPHTRRSRKVSLLGENLPESIYPFSNGDLISFDSPATVPSRVRRRTSDKSKKVICLETDN